jgi:hypothetical protein
MPNWCENSVLIRGPADEIRRYKDSLLKDPTGKNYPWLSTAPFPKLKDEAEVLAYIEKESNTGTGFSFQCHAMDLEVIENSPEELELHFYTAYSQAANLCPEELLPKLTIFHGYVEPINNFHGFVHYVKGKIIAEGYEQEGVWGETLQMFDYKPWPDGVDQL